MLTRRDWLKSAAAGAAVAAVPGDPEWKQTLREAERELLAAPN